jgi:hypothetical protein
MAKFDSDVMNYVFEKLIKEARDPFIEFVVLFEMMGEDWYPEERFFVFSAQQFAARGGLGYRRIDRALSALVDAKWLLPHENNATAGDSRLQKMFRVNWDKVLGKKAPVEKAKVEVPRLMVVVGDHEGEPFSIEEYSLDRAEGLVKCHSCGRYFDSSRRGGGEFPIGSWCSRCRWVFNLEGAAASGTNNVKFWFQGNEFTFSRDELEKELDRLSKEDV